MITNPLAIYVALAVVLAVSIFVDFRGHKDGHEMSFKESSLWSFTFTFTFTLGLFFNNHWFSFPITTGFSVSKPLVTGLPPLFPSALLLLLLSICGFIS